MYFAVQQTQAGMDFLQYRGASVHGAAIRQSNILLHICCSFGSLSRACFGSKILKCNNVQISMLTRCKGAQINWLDAFNSAACLDKVVNGPQLLNTGLDSSLSHSFHIFSYFQPPDLTSLVQKRYNANRVSWSSSGFTAAASTTACRKHKKNWTKKNYTKPHVGVGQNPANITK